MITYKMFAKVFRFRTPKRSLSNKVAEKMTEEKKVNAWQIHSYGDVNELQLRPIRIPTVEDPDSVLVKVEAASVNPIDLLMMGGYGRTLLQVPRKFKMELPLTLGRDFCGTVVYKGMGVGTQLEVGDKVYGFIPAHKQGSFSEVVVAEKSHVQKKPEHLSETECTSLVYATMTAWCALYIMGGLTKERAKDCRVLILGASGGVGTAAVQLLKSQGCQVYGSCSADAAPLVQSLGADHVFDYRDPDYLMKVADGGLYNIILDCAKFGFDNIPRTWMYNTFITLNSPLLINTDKYGLAGGLLASAGTLLKANFRLDSKSLKWGYFVPSGTGFQFIHQLILDKKLKPQIHKEFPFDQLPEAFNHVSRGHLRGKVVVKF